MRAAEIEPFQRGPNQSSSRPESLDGANYLPSGVKQGFCGFFLVAVRTEFSAQVVGTLGVRVRAHNQSDDNRWSEQPATLFVEGH